MVPLHILGDPAYPLSEKIVKGFVGTNLSPEDDSFNVYLSSTRMCVEIAFGKLKSRWRMLQKRMDVDTSMSPQVITACCILHNICEDLRVPMPQQNVQADAANAAAFPQPECPVNHRVDNDEGARIRNAIKTHLARTQPIRKSFHR